MDTLWAPWRMAYIVEDADTAKQREELNNVVVGETADATCFLCQAVYDQARDRQRYVICRTGSTISVLNRFPYNNGHLLVAPKRHRGRLDELTTAEKIELVEEIDRWVGILERKMRPDGFNIGLNLGRSAGAGLPGHLHWHIVPRWNGDTNYMTTVASTRVISQALDALWEILMTDPDA